MRIVIAIAMLALFCGCQQPVGKYGNFAAVDGVDLVQDAVAVMQSVYPPAKTRLNLLQPVEDAFGIPLVESLRGSGYAVAEYAPTPKNGKEEASAESAVGLGFGYVVDRDKEGWLRVTLYVGDETLSRLYRTEGDEGSLSYPPLGHWGRKH